MISSSDENLNEYVLGKIRDYSGYGIFLIRMVLLISKKENIFLLMVGIFYKPKRD